MFQVRPKQVMQVEMPDRVCLDADVYYPDIDATLPVLLMRQPYGRAIASTVVYAHPAWYAAQGYIVVIQDVRGSGSSAGEFRLFEAEIADGAATVEWAANLPGSNGCVGMYGFSYQGMTQLYAAAAQPEPLKTICPAMIGYDLYRDWAYEGDAFCLQANLGWALQLAALMAQKRQDEAAFLALTAAAQQLPLHDRVPTNPEILQTLAADSFYYDWLKRSPQDEYWQKLSPKTYASALARLPMLHIGGWFDPFLRGTIGLYEAMATQSTQPQHLVVGPWAHLPWGRKVGAIDFGEAAISPIDRLQLRWFDYWLKGIDNGVLGNGESREPSVRLFDLGSKEWRLRDGWPTGDATTTTLYLHTTGLTAMTDGELSPEIPAPIVPQPDTWVHDPWRPVPASGSHASATAGPFERSAIDGRSDVLTYTTAPLTEGLSLCGPIQAVLYCTADAVSWDLSVVLSQVQPNGQVYNMAQGYQRCHRSMAQPITITLQPTCLTLAKGQRLRLTVSGTCFPAYPVNPGTGDRPELAPKMQQQVITLALHSQKTAASNIILTISDP